MAKRSTDLLEVFHRPRGDDEDSLGRKRRARGSRSMKGTSRKRRKLEDFQGVFLAPRQVLLTSCVLVLLLVLSFLVGLGMGQRGAPEGRETALARGTGQTTVRGFYIRGRIMRQDVMGRKRTDPGQFVADLVDLSDLERRHLHIEDGSASHWWLYYGPFQSEAHARRDLERRNLAFLGVRVEYPFSQATIVRR